MQLSFIHLYTWTMITFDNIRSSSDEGGSAHSNICFLSTFWTAHISNSQTRWKVSSLHLPQKADTTSGCWIEQKNKCCFAAPPPLTISLCSYQQEGDWMFQLSRLDIQCCAWNNSLQDVVELHGDIMGINETIMCRCSVYLSLSLLKCETSYLI